MLLWTLVNCSIFNWSHVDLRSTSSLSQRWDESLQKDFITDTHARWFVCCIVSLTWGSLWNVQRNKLHNLETFLTQLLPDVCICGMRNRRGDTNSRISERKQAFIKIPNTLVITLSGQLWYAAHFHGGETWNKTAFSQRSGLMLPLPRSNAITSCSRTNQHLVKGWTAEHYW